MGRAIKRFESPIIMRYKPYYHEVQEDVWVDSLQDFVKKTKISKGFTTEIVEYSWYTPYMLSYAYTYSYDDGDSKSLPDRIWDGVKWVFTAGWRNKNPNNENNENNENNP